MEVKVIICSPEELEKKLDDFLNDKQAKEKKIKLFKQVVTDSQTIVTTILWDFVGY